MICCCFHGENSPSLGVHFGRQAFRCMSCGKKGRGQESMEYLLKSLFGRYNKSEFEEEAEEKKVDLSSLMDKLRSPEVIKSEKIKVLVNFNSSNFRYPENEYGSYLRKRNIDKPKVVKDFDIKGGYWRGDKRIIIPMEDEYGRLISVFGRSIVSNEKDIRIRKSKNSDVSKTLFGLKQIIRNNYYGFYKVGVGVEGEIDVVYLHQFGIPAFCFGSKEVSEIQLIKMLKYFDIIYISLDGDVDGKTLRKLKNKISEYIGEVVIIKMPSPEMDPNKLSEKQINEVYGIFRGGKKTGKTWSWLKLK